MKQFAIAIVFIATFLSVAEIQAIPPGFNIQGRLTDASGVNKDGTFQIKFSIFSADTGGAAVWEKTISSVLVKNGNFQVILQGAGDVGGQLEAAVKDMDTAYVEIKVGNEARLVPRQSLLRSPFPPPTVNLLGAVMFFAGPTCQEGWILANGAVLADLEQFKPLAQYLGSTYGAYGQLPNLLDGSFLRGTGGKAAPLGSKQEDEFKSHTHTLPRYSGMGYSSNISALGNSLSWPIPTAAAGGDETRPRNYAMTPCVRY